MGNGGVWGSNVKIRSYNPAFEAQSNDNTFDDGTVVALRVLQAIVRGSLSGEFAIPDSGKLRIHSTCPENLTKSTIVLQTFISKFKVLYKLPVIIHPLIHVSSLIANEMGECAFYCRISRNIRNIRPIRDTFLKQCGFCRPFVFYRKRYR